MRFLFCGDVMGQAGRKALKDHLPTLRQTYSLDAVVVNAENAANGYGLTRKIVEELHGYGVDVLTTGNHVWDQREFIKDIPSLPSVLRPLNYPKNTPGAGFYIHPLRNGQRLAVLNVMGRLYMDALDDPFAAVDAALEGLYLGIQVHAMMVDIHAEANSEKQAMGCHLDGRVSLVVGTHTHVPTADARILPNGTAFMTDAGMCGDYDSIIGMKKELVLPRMRSKVPGEKLIPADKQGTLSGVIVDTDNTSGLAREVLPIRVGGVLGMA
jgi:2',3'-cyclic-nucleotide 2'-phosphodiesterase